MMTTAGIQALQEGVKQHSVLAPWNILEENDCSCKKETGWELLAGW